jgi:hypothetical protein
VRQKDRKKSPYRTCLPGEERSASAEEKKDEEQTGEMLILIHEEHAKSTQDQSARSLRKISLQDQLSKINRVKISRGKINGSKSSRGEAGGKGYRVFESPQTHDEVGKWSQRWTGTRRNNNVGKHIRIPTRRP